MSADVIDFTTGSEFKEHVEEAAQYASVINEFRDKLKPFRPHRQISIICQVLAAILCGLGGRNACGMLASSWFGVFCRELMTEVNKVFPPSSEEGTPP